MDQTSLVGLPIDAGRNLYKMLKEFPFQARLAFWRYYESLGEWRLVLASPMVDREGPQAAYRLVFEAIQAMTNSQIRLSDIEVTTVNNRFITELLRYELTRHDPDDLKISKMPFKDDFVEQAYVYSTGEKVAPIFRE